MIPFSRDEISSDTSSAIDEIPPYSNSAKRVISSEAVFSKEGLIIDTRTKTETIPMTTKIPILFYTNHYEIICCCLIKNKELS